MPDIICPASIKCPCDDSPIGNYSAEAPDRITFNSIGFPIYNPYNPLGDDPHDPLNPAYTAAGCEVVCVSTVSQEAANDCAAVDAYLCENGGRNPPPDVPTVFYNDQQTCAFPCPDGSLFTWTVLAGTVVAPNQDLANRIAASIACQRAASHRLCLPALSGGCLNQPFSQTVTVTTGQAPLTFTITAGALPPGVTMTPSGTRSVIIAGTPTAAGTFAFTLTVQDPNGNYFSKAYQFQVLGIAPDTLPDADAGVAYSQTLTATGGVAPYTFALEIGDLPDGITLADDGTLSGTPTVAGSFDVTISVTDSSTLFCTKDYTIKAVVAGFQICNWATVLSQLTIPGSWAASALPAWDGKFPLQTTWTFGVPGNPLWYFIGASIGGKKVSADECALYPNGNWQNLNCPTALFYHIATGAWTLEFETVDCADPNFLEYILTNNNPNDPTGVYAKNFAVGADGPDHITVQRSGSTSNCCATTADWVNQPVGPTGCRLRIVGYVDTLFGACAACNSGAIWPVWDGAFPHFAGFGSYTIDPGLGLARDVHGKISGFIHIDWDPFGQVWNLTVQCDTGGGPIAQWYGQSAGTDPVGVYTQTAGCPGGPASVTVEGYLV